MHDNMTNEEISAYELESIKDVLDWFAYLSSDCKTVTTWIGEKLGSVTYYNPSRRARKCFIRMTDVHGGRWYGSGPLDSGTYVRLHRVKG